MTGRKGTETTPVFRRWCPLCGNAVTLPLTPRGTHPCPSNAWTRKTASAAPSSTGTPPSPRCREHHGRRQAATPGAAAASGHPLVVVARVHRDAGGSGRGGDRRGLDADPGHCRHLGGRAGVFPFFVPRRRAFRPDTGQFPGVLRQRGPVARPQALRDDLSPGLVYQWLSLLRTAPRGFIAARRIKVWPVVMPPSRPPERFVRYDTFLPFGS